MQTLVLLEYNINKNETYTKIELNDNSSKDITSKHFRSTFILA